MPRVAAYSPSRLAVYQRCPRRYYWQYVIRVPRKRTGEQSVGISLHGALEAVEQAGGLTATGVAGALALLQDRWEGEGFASAEEEATARQAAQRMLKAYLEAMGEGESVPVMLEQKLKGSFDAVPLIGIVDRVDRRPDGTLELIDYKSGRSAASGTDPEVTQQLAIYRHLIAETTGAPPARVTVHHLDAGVIPIALAPTEWDALLAKAASTARAIEREDDYTPRVGPACRRCDYSGRCLAYQNARRAQAALAADAADLL